MVLLVQGCVFPDAAQQAEVGGSLEVQLLLGPAQLLAGDLPRRENKPRTLHLRTEAAGSHAGLCSRGQGSPRLTLPARMGDKEAGWGEPARTRWARKAATMCR